MYLQVWSSEQYARAVVASGPYHVDALAIASCAATEEQHQQHGPETTTAHHVDASTASCMECGLANLSLSPKADHFNAALAATAHAS